MKLPIFVGTRPNPKDSPLILLDSGKWVVSSNHSDSHINLSVGDTLYTGIEDGLEFELSAPSTLKAAITIQGSEPSISIYVTKSTDSPQ